MTEGCCRSVYMCHRMRLGSKQYPVEYFKRTTCRLILRMPQSFVQDGALTWMAVLSHLELWAEIEWKERHGLDFCGQKTMNSADPALTTEPTNANRTLYEWTPHHCSLVPLQPQSSCASLRHKQLLFAGDSTTAQVLPPRS